MSEMSSLSSHIEEEALVLRELSDSITKIQAAALGDLGILDISEDEVKKARQIVIDFIKQLLSALEGNVRNPAIQVLISTIDNGPIPKEDWIADLKNLYQTLEDEKLDSDSILEPIEDILAILSDDYAESIKALYHDW
jgi:hypothetical protein